MKVAVYAIAKNESQFVERFCKSAAEADYVIIADTGSEDNTVELARAQGAIVHETFISPWRFDVARNAALSLVPKDADICVSLDLDEVLTPGWRKIIEDLWTPGTTRFAYLFDYGNGLQSYKNSIHARVGYHWQHICHEVLVADPRSPEAFVCTDVTLATHRPDVTKSREQYIDMLAAGVKERPTDPRDTLYYARELTYQKRWPEAIEQLTRFISMPTHSWDERSYAWRLLGDAREGMGDLEGALYNYRSSVVDNPGCRSPWYAQALAYYRRNNFVNMHEATTMALKITTRSYSYTEDPASWSWQLHDLHALASYRIGSFREAVEHGQIACDAQPFDGRLTANLGFYRQAMDVPMRDRIINLKDIMEAIV